MNETTPDTKALRRSATRGKGKEAKEASSLWVNTFEEVIRTNPCGIVLVEDAQGRPKKKERPFTKKTAWAIETYDKGEWKFTTFFNLDKTAGAIRFTHTVKWAMDKLRAEREFFDKGTFDRCNVRLRNLVSNDIIMAAILL